MLQTNVVKKMKTRILYSVISFPGNLTVYEVMWINTVEPDRPHTDDNGIGRRKDAIGMPDN